MRVFCIYSLIRINSHINAYVCVCEHLERTVNVVICFLICECVGLLACFLSLIIMYTFTQTLLQKKVEGQIARTCSASRKLDPCLSLSLSIKTNKGRNICPSNFLKQIFHEPVLDKKPTKTAKKNCKFYVQLFCVCYYL